jgi:hypothetical protein
VGFEDLLQVLGDVAGFKYHPQTNNGFNAVIKVLSEWGWLPAGKLPSQDHVMPSANWMPLSKRDKIQWAEVFDWANKTNTSIEIYSGYNPHNPHTIEMPRGMLFPPDYVTNDSDQEFARLNLKPWVDLGCKKIWFDWAMLKNNPPNRATFLKNAQWLEKEYGITVGGEAIPSSLGLPDMKYISKHPFLAMYKYLMDPNTGRDLGKWEFPNESEVIAVMNSKSNREYFTPSDYLDMSNRGYILAATTIDQAIAIKNVLR